MDDKRSGMKYDAMLEEAMFELVFAHFGSCSVDLSRKLAIKSHDHYGVENDGESFILEDCDEHTYRD